MRPIRQIAAVLLLGFAAHGAQAQSTIGVSSGVVIGDKEGLYVDDPCDCWIDRQTGFTAGVQYYRSFTAGFRFGAYAEMETIATPVEDGMRIGGGVTWLGRTRDVARGPALELGGTLGVSHASLGEFDGQFGPDFSVFVGPAARIAPGLDAAVHLVALYGWYGGGTIPEGIQNAQLRVRLQLYHDR